MTMMMTITRIITTGTSCMMLAAVSLAFSRQLDSQRQASSTTGKFYATQMHQNHHNHHGNNYQHNMISTRSYGIISSQQQQRQQRQQRQRRSYFSSLSTQHNDDDGENNNNQHLPPTRNTSTQPFSTSTSSSSPSSFYQNHLQNVHLQNDYYALRHGQSLANVAGIIASNPTVACYNYGLSPVGQHQAHQAANDILQQYYPTYSNDDNDDDDEQHSVYQGIVILTSDLLRAQQTAQIVAKVILEENNNPINNVSIPLFSQINNHTEMTVVVHTDIQLRERGFGDWDGGSDVHYQDVWDEDSIDPYHTHGNVESVWSVLDRATQCLIDWDIRLTTGSTTSSSSSRPDHLPQQEQTQPNQTQQQRPWMVVCIAHGDVLQILQTALITAPMMMDPSQHRLLPHLETATLRPLWKK
jgi:broad specificity phosphatase PhoE